MIAGSTGLMISLSPLGSVKRDRDTPEPELTDFKELAELPLSLLELGSTERPWNRLQQSDVNMRRLSE